MSFKIYVDEIVCPVIEALLPNQTKVPSETAVSKTPNVERTSPSRRMGFTDVQLVYVFNR
jgi:hypothetical protein